MSLFRRGDDSDSDEDASVVQPVADGSSQDAGPSERVSRAASEVSDGEDGIGMFGDMLKLEENAAAGSSSGAQADDGTSSTTVTLREFPLPKHMPSSTIMPKKMLADVLSGAGTTNAERAAAKGKAKELHAICEYREISGGSRAHRVHLEISWIKGKADVKGKGSNGSGSARSTRTPTPARTPPPPALWPDQDQSLVTFTRNKKLLNETIDGTAGGDRPAQAQGAEVGTSDTGEGAAATLARPPPERKPTPRNPNVAHHLEYKMLSVGCPSASESENYAATIALHQLTTGTNHCGSKALGLVAEIADGKVPEEAPAALSLPTRYPSVNAKNLPLVYRDLWDELEVVRIEREDEDKRKLWAQLESIVDAASSQVEHGEVVPAEANGKLERNGDEPQHDVRGQAIRTAKPSFNPAIQEQWDRRIATPQFQKMLAQRANLPIAAFREEIVRTVQENQVMILSGETGCGKSTQLPSFLLESCLSHGQDCKIFVTEPRRISAISLAQRVAQELGEPPNPSGNGLVGYSIRLENTIGAHTKLAFVTNGIALRMLESGASDAERSGKATSFDQVTHIIIDEVHERSIDSDFLLIVLKQLIHVRRDLKVILMSATLEAEKLSRYFEGCPVLAVPGRTFPVKVAYLEDAVQFARYDLDPSSPYALRARDQRAGRFTALEWTEDNAASEDESDGEKPADPLKLSSAQYSKKTIDTVNLLDPRQIPYELIVRILEVLCLESAEHQDYSQAILIFLPGLQEIRKMHDALVDHRVFGHPDMFQLFPLHSTISSEGQSAVFDIPPPGIRKIVMATNIAETGITIPDITAVIDTGKHREMKYDEKRQISRLSEAYIARSNATQRRGRAGRVQEGMAFHLFTRARFENQMQPHPLPEMLRLSLQDLALRIKILRVRLGATISEALALALDPPAPLNVMRAVNSLVEVGALKASDESITPLGRLLSKLPVDVHLGKFLLYSAIFRCLDPALTIAATLNAKSPFVTPFGQEQQADTVKASFKTGNSDFLTIHNVYSIWRRMSNNPNAARTWCRKNFLSQQTLGQIEELRQQLYSYLIETGFIQISDREREGINRARYSRGWRTQFVDIPGEWNEHAEDHAMIGAALAAGLYPKLLVIDGSTGGLKTITNNAAISIHPTSVNFRMRPADFASTFIVYFTIMQSKKLYAWETGPVSDLAVFLLCSETVEYKLWASTAIVDRKLRFEIPPRTLLALRALREGFGSALAQWMRGRALTDEQRRWWEMGLRCLKTPDKEEQVATLERIGISM